MGIRMSKSVVAMLVLVFLTASCIIIAKPVVCSSDIPGFIIIREDGGIEGTDKIQRIGDVYTFTGDIDISGGYTYAGIQVLKDNIMIDGAHLSISTQDSGNIGIDLSGRTNVIVKNLEIKGFKQGVFLDNASGNTIYGNEIVGFTGDGPYGVPTGIWVSSSSNNKIESNNITSNIDFGILLHAGSTNNIIVGNILTGNGVGLALNHCPNNTLKNNQIDANNQNFKLGYNSFSQFIQDIDTSNTIDGKPVYYWINEHNKSVPSDAGFVALGNCANITVRDLQISHSYDSISLINTNDSIITNNYVDNCGNGIFLKYCQNINVTGNTVTANLDSGIGTIACNNIIIAENNIDSCKFGISTSGQTSNHVGGSGSTNMTIYKNNITRNDPGIYLSLSTNNLISNNYIAENLKGINAISSFRNIIIENTFVENNEGAVRISGAQNNTFYHNNFIDNNASGIQISNPWLVKGNPEDNIWDNGFEGNYWSDFKQRHPNATEISGSGVWNTPYYINEKNIDHYPLVAPFVPDQSSSIPQPTSPDTKPSDSTPSEFQITLAVISIATSAVIIAIGLLVYLKKRNR
jgi:parallel beta-helix repeat protein